MSSSLANVKSDRLVTDFLKRKSADSMLKLVNYAKKDDLGDDGIIKLACGLAESGIVIKDIGVPLCDIPSTGGPGSLSTLLCPVLLRLLGNYVFKLGVSGRPAGGIDVLAQIKGYNIYPDASQLRTWLDENMYVHFLASHNFTPLDSLLFDFRKANGFLDIHSLVIASILSKKIALNLKYVGLDVRVSSFGNFGANYNEARANSERFNRVADRLGIESICFLTNGENPQQPYIGRGESILALQHVFSESNKYLEDHFRSLLQMAVKLSKNKNVTFGIRQVEQSFFENVNIQGGSKSSFYEIADHIEKSHIFSIRAKRCGFLTIDLKLLRDAIVEIQSQIKTVEFPDPCGVILAKMAYEYLTEGEIICTYRCDRDFKEHFTKRLENCFGLSDHSNSINYFEVVN